MTMVRVKHCGVPVLTGGYVCDGINVTVESTAAVHVGVTSPPVAIPKLRYIVRVL